MSIVFAGATERLEREHQGRAWQAWHIAALPRAKDFPALATFMGGKRQPRQQTPEQIAKNLRLMFPDMPE